MLARSIAALAALALAANVAAEPRPYQPQAMKMSTRALFGVVRRSDTEGYQPDLASCNEGNSCAEACGAGYETCSSSDNQIHCFNPTVGEICCPNKSGDSCEAGFYCTSDDKGATWCCPNEMDLAACAAAYSIGTLVSQTPPPATTTSTSTSSSTTVPPTTTTTTTSSSSASFQKNSTTIASKPSTTKTYLPSSSFGASNTTAPTAVSPPVPTGSGIAEGAGSVVGPAGALVLLAAGVAALL